ncbi:MAG: dihydroorotate dehydrogenase [Candidatus Aenigmarchaeota archaeon]|nr:dihydroorotate dehydrogenase [Candidatus Aenigmarchaeota archaeon]
MIIKTSFLRQDLKNPLVLSAGILGVSHSTMIRAYNSGAAAVTTKSISIAPRQGHKNPTVIAYEKGLMNAVGLSNPGIDAFTEEIKKTRQKNIPLILNTIGDTPQEMAQVAKKGEIAGAGIIELNPSCPNVTHEKPYASDPKLLKELITTVKKQVKIPVIVKLSPNVENIKTIAKAAEQAGADGITAINTVGPGMLIDIASKKPVLDFKTGGISGPAIRPIAVRCVYDIYETVKIPIIGVGGITSANDAIEMMMAGATLAGIGSAIYYHDISIFKKIANDMEIWMKDNGYKTTEELIGAAHV